MTRPAPTSAKEPARAAVDIVIRFKNSLSTLPRVLVALSRQSFQDFRLIGVDTGSTDDSADLIRRAGGEIIIWSEAYHHSCVLNFGVAHGSAALVLALSSHTALSEDDTLEKLVAAMADSKVACVTAKWDDDAFYSDAVDWNELKTKGLTLDPIYSNSMGMFRRFLWQEIPFGEKIEYAEGYAWMVEQLAKGYVCRRLSFPFQYERKYCGRSYEVSLTVFTIAKKHGLQVTWPGAKATFVKLLRLKLKRLLASEPSEELNRESDDHKGKLRAWYAFRRF